MSVINLSPLRNGKRAVDILGWRLWEHESFARILMRARYPPIPPIEKQRSNKYEQEEKSETSKKNVL